MHPNSPQALNRSIFQADVKSAQGHRTSVEVVYLAIATSVLWAVLVERPHYLRHLGTVEMNVNFRTFSFDVITTFFLVAKSLLYLLPGLAVFHVVSRSKWATSAVWCFCALTTLAFTCCWLDMRIFHATGNHILAYATFAFSPDAWEWAGRDSGLLSQVFLQGTLASGIVLLALWALRYLYQLCSRRLRRASVFQKRIALTSYGMLMVGGLATAEVGTTRRIHSELRQAIPISVPVIHLRAAPVRNEAITEPQFAVIQEAYAVAQPRLEHPPEADQRVVALKRRPHIVLLMLESLRSSACVEEIMPRVSEWAKTGVRCDLHYSSSNCSQFGVFSLLYGRWPLAYEQTLTSRIPPQACVTLRNAGYECTFVTSADDTNYRRMGEFLNEETFDRVVQFTDGEWYSRDRESLAEVRRTIAVNTERPQFVVAFLMSTHVNYSFPDAFAKFKPYAPDVDLLDPNIAANRDEILNRYHNSAYYLDHEIGELLQGLSPEDTIVAITGDHGESMREDGTYGHASKLSDVQIRTPFILAGNRVPPAVAKYRTSHVDFLPTILHLLNGEPTRLDGMHGESIFDRSRSPSVLLVNGGFFFHLYQQWDDILIVDKSTRLRFLANRTRPAINFLGRLDGRARSIDEEADTLAVPAGSVEAAAKLLRRIGGEDDWP